MNRRNFINSAAISYAGLGMIDLLPSGINYQSTPSDRVNIALVGCRNMGFGDLRQHLAIKGVTCTALCDVDSGVLNQRAAEISKTYNQAPKLYTDFRKLLEQKDIDAVIIGTPDHWHCLIAVYALQAGKDIYVEKPMANTIAECNLIVKAANRYNDRIVQVGQQQRSGFIFKKAIELIESGSIGKLRKINVWANFNYGVGQPLAADEPVPEGVDFDMWLGPAPSRTFNKTRFHGSWRMFWDYGGGLASDWGVHLLDVALWAGKITTGPEKVLVYGAQTYHEPRSRETFDTMSVVYPCKDLTIHFDVTAGIEQGPYDSPYGLAFIGDLGTLTVNRSKLFLHPEWDSQGKKNKTEEYQFTEGKESHDEHARNFIECIRSRKKPACPPETGRAAALHVHIPNIAARCGESYLEWDDSKGLFRNSEAANKLITPVYRKPWELPVI
jgi:predicted dehydrogenase